MSTKTTKRKPRRPPWKKDRLYLGAGFTWLPAAKAKTAFAHGHSKKISFGPYWSYTRVFNGRKGKAEKYRYLWYTPFGPIK